MTIQRSVVETTFHVRYYEAVPQKLQPSILK
jgi:hypothetical protein